MLFTILQLILRDCYPLVVSEILKKCYKKRNKALLDINFLKNCKTLNDFPKFIQFDIPLANSSNVRYIKKGLVKNALHKRFREQKNLHMDLGKKFC